MKKRLLSMLLALVLVLTMLPMSVLAEESGTDTTAVYYVGLNDEAIFIDKEYTEGDTIEGRETADFVAQTYSGEVPEGKHAEWLIVGDADGRTIPEGEAFSIYKNDTISLKVVFVDCESNDVGFCEICGTCMHTKGEDDLCTDVNCEHTGCTVCGGPGSTEPGGSVLPPVDEEDPQPTLPAAPTSLIGLGLSVVVECGHPDHNTPVSYDVIAGTWEDKVEVYYLETDDAKEPYEYYCSIRVDEDEYISMFDIDAKGIHTNATKNIPSFTLIYKDDEWVAVDKKITIFVECVPDTPAAPIFTIYPEAGKHGTVSSEGWPVYVEEGDDVTFWFYPDKGYEVSAVYVDGYPVNYYGLCYDHYWDCDGCEDCWWVDWSEWYDCDDPWCDHWHDHWYDCDDWCGHRYVDCDWSDWQDCITFYDVDANHDLYVEFAPIDSGCPSDYYYDLNTEAWYHEATDFVIANDIMKGVGGKYFDPNGTTTRGQLVTMLYRLAGEPKVSGGSEFLDVTDGKWYTDAVIWAAKKGIVDGYGNGYFGVFDTVTREQTVTILYRYAKYMGVSVSKLADLKYFIDAKNVSDFAEEPFGWAVKRDIIEGKAVSGGSLKLDPQGATARVEMAAMLMRFAEYVD